MLAAKIQNGEENAMTESIIWKGKDLTKEEVKKCIKIIENNLKKSKIEVSIIHKNNYNISFIPKDDEKLLFPKSNFAFLSEYNIKNSELVAKRLNNIETPGNVISANGFLKGASVDARTEMYLELLKNIFNDIQKELNKEKTKIIVHFVL